jgi:hypothetical protein
MPTKTRSADADKQLELLQRRIADCDDKFAEEKVKCIAAQQKIEACDARIDKIDEKIETSKMDLDSTIRIAFLNADDEICEQDVQDQEDKASDAKDLDASKAQPNMFDASSAQSNYKFVSANASESTVHSNLDSNSTTIESDVDSDATDLNVDASKAQFDMLDASSAQSIELKVVDMNLGFHCAAIVSKLNNTLLISSDHDIAFGKDESASEAQLIDDGGASKAQPIDDMSASKAQLIDDNAACATNEEEVNKLKVQVESLIAVLSVGCKLQSIDLSFGFRHKHSQLKLAQLDVDDCTMVEVYDANCCFDDKNKYDCKLDTKFENTNLCLLWKSTIHLKKIKAFGCTIYSLVNSLGGDYDFQITDFNFGFYFAHLDPLVEYILDTTDVHYKYVFDTIMFLEKGESCLSTLELDSHGVGAGCGPGNLFGLLSYLEYFEMSGVTSRAVYSDAVVANVESLDNG